MFSDETEVWMVLGTVCCNTGHLTADSDQQASGNTTHVQRQQVIFHLHQQNPFLQPFRYIYASVT